MQFSTFVSIALSFVAVVSAQQKSGQNAFTHPLGGTIDASQPLALAWTPTTTGTVTIKLLKGPTTNILDIDVVVSYFQNSGSYTWNIPKSLEDSSTMPEGDKYGLKIIDDATGTYEYSPPFDISVPGSTYGGASGSGSSGSSSSASSEIKSTSTKATSTSAAQSTSTAQKTTAIAQSTTEATATPTMIQEQPVETEASAATTFATKTTAAPKATATTTAAAGEEPESPPPNILFIAGIGAGGIVLCGFIILGLCLCCRSKKRKSTSPIENSMRRSKLYANGDMYNRV